MGLLPENSLLPVTSNRNMLAQALKARQQPRNQLTGQGLLDTAAIGLGPVPIVGDALGLAADASRFYNEPESRTPLNFGLAALGLIPFVPPLVSAGLGKFAQSQGKTLTAPSMSGPARNQAGAIVYHGSPHKFDQFDSSKIGTGEGAQAYGHGLYFAENPAVAKSYQETLTDRGGSSFHKTSTSYKVGDKEIFKDSPDYAAASVASDMKTWGIDPKSKDGKDWLNSEVAARYMGSQTNSPSELKKKALQFLKSGVSEETSRGALYKVDLPDEAIAKMLDYDAPLSKQPEAVKSAIQNLDIPYGGFKESPKQVAEFNKSIPADTAVKYPDVSANQFYHDLVDRLGSAKAASEYLRNLGIPGIKYYDAGSRGTNQGTRNYVTFPGNEGLLKILGRE